MFLGVDGGGTKTAVCLLRSDGTLAGRARAAGIYYLADEIELVDRVLATGIADVCDQAGISSAEIDYAFFGLPSYGEVSGDVPALDAAPRAVLGHDRYACDNDSVCAWAGSLGGADGINVVSGTGSIAYGRRLGRGVRVGGWGELFGDEGSAYWIAIHALNAVSRMSDGRLAEGPLAKTIRGQLQLQQSLDLIDVVIHRWHGSRREIAGLSRHVVAAADLGDVHAAGILADAGRELALLADTARARLGYGEAEAIKVSYSGGGFSTPRILGAFKRELTALGDGYVLSRPLYPPVIGAALYAATLAGKPLEPDALRRLHSSSSAT